MMNLYETANAPTLTCDRRWMALTDQERILEILRIIEKNNPRFSCIDVVYAKVDGQVILRLTENLGASLRGLLLLDFEEVLKSSVDKGLTVWLEPIGDKSSLRKLRGIEVKNS